jgi:hypothetical protein
MKGAMLALYRLMLFRDDELVGQVGLHCADDLDALDVARELSKDHAVEAYLEQRLVARVKYGDEPLNLRNRHSGWRN